MSSQGKQLKQTVKNSAIYAIGTTVRRLTGLVMLPIYTRYLTPTDYGVVELLMMAIEVASILVGMRISQGMFRYYILAESDQEKNEVASTVLLTIIGTSFIGALFLYMGSETLTKLIFGNTEYIYEFQLFALTLITNAIAAVGLSYVRARQKPILFVSIGIATLVLQVILNIVFVVVMELHVTGVVYSAVISGGVVAIGLSLYLLFHAGVHYSTYMAVKLWNFVAPLILASLAAFYVAYADKYFLRLFGGLSEVGLYSLAARLSAVLMTVFEAFYMSWAADRFEIVKNDNANQVYEQIFRFLSAVIILMAVGLALFADDFLRIMTSPAFYPAGGIVPVLVLGLLFRIASSFCNFGAVYKDRTSILAQASWLMALVATVSYLLLIPAYGMYGAAIGLAISSFAEFFWVHTRSTRQYDMGLKWNAVMVMMVCATVIVLAGLLFPVGDVTYFSVRVVMFIVLVLAFYLMPFWNNDERVMIRAGLKKLKVF